MVKCTSCNGLPGAHALVRSYCRNAISPDVAQDELNFTMKRSPKSAPRGKIHKMSPTERGLHVERELMRKGSPLNGALMKHLDKKGLFIVSWHAQLRVPSRCPIAAFHGYAPILDILCMHKGTGRRVPIEVKSTCHQRVRKRGKHDVGLRSPMDAFADTWSARHHLQLAVQNAAVGNTKSEGFLLYVESSTSLKITPLNRDVWGALTASCEP